MIERVSKQINILRVVFIVMVVYIHSTALPVLDFEINVPEYVNFIKWLLGNSGGLGTLAVPGFYCISGYLLFRKKINWIDNLKKKAYRLFLPFIAVNLFWTLFFKLMQSISVTRQYFLSEQYQVVGIEGWIKALLSDSPMYYPFWFLWYLLILNVIAPIIQFMLEKVPLLLIAGLLLLEISSFSIPYMSTTAVFFFTLGGILAEYSDIFEKVCIKVPVIIWGSVYLILTACVYLLNIPRIQDFITITGLMFLFGAAGMITDRNERLSAFLIKLSPYSFFLYLSHEFYEAIIKKIVMTIFPQAGMVQLAELLFLPILVISICFLIGKYFDSIVKVNFVRASMGLKPLIK